MVLTTSWTTIEGAAAGNQALADEFVRTYSPALTDYLAARWRLPGTAHRVSEAVQCIFMDCLRPSGALQRADPHREGGFRAFFFGVARTAALRIETVRAREAARTDGTADFEQIPSDEESAAVAFDRAWVKMTIREALKGLMERRGAAGRTEEEVLRLRYFEGLKAGQIARKLGVGSDEIYQVLYRARRSFHESLLEVIAFGDPMLRRDELEKRALEFLRILNQDSQGGTPLESR